MDTGATDKRITTVTALCIAAVVLYALWSLYQIIQTTAPDFSVLYLSAKNLLSGKNIYEDSALFTGLGYPSVSLIPFIVFTFVPYTFAQAVWTIGSFTAFLGSTYFALRAVKKFSWKVWMIVSSIAFLSFPTKFTFGMGQANFYALGLLLLGVSEIPMHPFVRRIVLALVLLLKPHLLLVYAGLYFTKHKASVIWSVVILLLCTLILGISTGWMNELSYVKDVVPKLMRFEGRDVYYNQGIQGFVARLAGSSGVNISNVLSFIVFSFSYGKILLKKKRTAFGILCILLPMFLLIEPLAWQHHAIFILPTMIALWYTLSKRAIDSRVWVLALSLFLISWNIKNPVYWQQSPVGALVLSHGFIGVMLTWVFALIFL